MPYRTKTYIAFDGDYDIRYYWLMKAWKHNQVDFFLQFNFFDAHEINTARDSSLEQTIKRRLKERLNNSKLFILLIGSQTRFLYRFVRWEIEQAISMDLPIIAVNLNGLKYMDSDRCPPILREELAIHISFNQKIIEYALNNWGESHREFRRQNKIEAYYYKHSIYQNLGIY
jgi:Thoeris protein ThsB, TIR-like domain